MKRYQPGQLSTKWKTARLILAGIFTFALASDSCAAITATGDVAPAYPGGNPDPWNVGDELIVADGSNGSVSITGGSDVLSSGGTLGFNSSTSGVVTVSGAGSTWINSGDLLIGVFGTGTLNVLDAGRVENQDASVGHVTGTGHVLVSGAGSQWLNASNLTIGNGASGTVRIEQQGLVNSGPAVIGLNEGSSGTVVVDGQQSSWRIASTLTLGDVSSGGSASVSLTGAGSRLYVGAAAIAQSGVLPIAQTALVVSDLSGEAHIAVYEGNQLMNFGNAYVGVGAGESGSVLVQGAGSIWSNGGDVFVGVDGAGTLMLAGGGHVSSGGTVSIGSAGQLSGSGAVTGALSNSGVVAPGHGAGALTVGGNYVQSAAGELQIELSGTAANQFSNLDSSAQASLTGTLVVNLGLDGGNPFVPLLGNAFPVLTATGGVTGQFTAADLPALAAGRMWQVRYSANAATLVVTLAGDYNDDGVVDAADYTVWRNLNGASLDPRADGDTNGVVNIADYNIWKANFGAVAGAGAAGNMLALSVPEPTAAASWLTVLALLSACSQWRRR